MRILNIFYQTDKQIRSNNNIQNWKDNIQINKKKFIGQSLRS